MPVVQCNKGIQNQEKLHVKLCGLRRDVDVAYANALLPDYVGFILAPSKRRVELDVLYQLSAMVNPRIQRVGVFVDEEPEVIVRLVQEGVIDIAQLHGAESEDYCYQLQQQGIPCWKAIRVRTAEDIQKLPSYPVEAILFDAFSHIAQGGTGEAFPHDWLTYYALDLPYLIAGGVTANNAALLAETYHPFGLDVSSGIESDGYKDNTKMTAFMEAVKTYRV